MYGCGNVQEIPARRRGFLLGVPGGQIHVKHYRCKRLQTDAPFMATVFIDCCMVGNIMCIQEMFRRGMGKNNCKMSCG